MMNKNGRPLEKNDLIVTKTLEKMTEQHHPVIRYHMYYRAEDIYDAIRNYEQIIDSALERICGVDNKHTHIIQPVLKQLKINLENSFGDAYRMQRDLYKLNSDING